MSRIIESFTSAFNTALQTGLNYKLQKMQIQQKTDLAQMAQSVIQSTTDEGEHEDIGPIHFHGDPAYMRGATYDPVAKIVNETWPSASTEEKTEYYNAIKSGMESAQIFFQHCKNQDVQLRILQLNSNGTVQSKVLEDGSIVPESSAVYFNTLSEFYAKGKELYKQATNVKFIGSIINIRNTSNDNGNALDVSISLKKSNIVDFYEAASYDSDGSNYSVYNKQSFTKFLPSSKFAYKTESIQKIMSSFAANPKFQEKKDEIYKKVADLLNMSVEELQAYGNNIRCLANSDPLDYEGILDFEAFKERCCGVDTKLQYPGTVATLFDTYIKLSTVSQETPYVFTLYGLFLLDKTVNDNINADLSAGEGEDDAEEVEYKYSIASVKQEEVEQVIEDAINEVGCAESRRMKIKAKAYRRMGIPIVVSGGKFVKEYEDRMKLEKGEKVVQRSSKPIRPK